MNKHRQKWDILRDIRSGGVFLPCQGYLGGCFMLVQDVMSKNVVSITPEESAALAARLLARHNLGALPVCSYDGRLVGIVTDRDIIIRCIAADQDPKRVPVQDIMSRELKTIEPKDDAHAAARRMADCQVRRLPVVSNGEVVGMVALGDLAVSHRCEMEAAEALSEISENVVRRHTNKGE
jgi:CBS domain-containing protein